MVVISFAAVPCASSAEPNAAQQEDEPPGTTRSMPSDALAAMEETLTKIDTLLAQLDARRKDAWARANEILDLADAAIDPEQQMRLEELYGKMATVADNFEEQYSRMSALRNALAIDRERILP